MLGELCSVRVHITTGQVDQLIATLVAIMILRREQGHVCTAGYNSIHVEGQRESYRLEYAGDFLGRGASNTKCFQVTCLCTSHRASFLKTPAGQGERTRGKCPGPISLNICETSVRLTPDGECEIRDIR